MIGQCCATHFIFYFLFLCFLVSMKLPKAKDGNDAEAYIINSALLDTLPEG